MQPLQTQIRGFFLKNQLELHLNTCINGGSVLISLWDITMLGLISVQILMNLKQSSGSLCCFYLTGQYETEVEVRQLHLLQAIKSSQVKQNMH